MSDWLYYGFPWFTRVYALVAFGFAIATVVVPTPLWSILVTWCWSLPVALALVWITRDP